MSKLAVMPVVLADISPPYINGIKLAFKYKEYIELLPACTLQEILEHLERNKNACVVLTDSMFAEFGNSCITAIRGKCNDVKIIVLIQTRQVHLLKNLVASGISALVSKYTKGAEIEEAVLHVQKSDQPFYCHRILKMLAEKSEMPQYVNGKKVSLSPQLVPVLWCLIDGMTYKEIACEMDLTDNTIGGYCKIVNAKIKLAKCKSPLEYGVKMGYFTMDQYLDKISDKKS